MQLSGLSTKGCLSETSSVWRESRSPDPEKHHLSVTGLSVSHLAPMLHPQSSDESRIACAATCRPTYPFPPNAMHRGSFGSGSTPPRISSAFSHLSLALQRIISSSRARWIDGPTP